MPRPSADQRLAYLIFVCGVATLAGFLFGFDAAVINGTVGALSREFASSSVGAGLSVASVLVGSAIGALLAGQYADRMGRRPLMLLTAALFTVGAAGAGGAQSAAMFFVVRLIGGFGVGAASVVAPAYVAEVSPAGIRGGLTTMQQLAIVLGLQCAFLSNYLIARAAGGPGAAWLLGLHAWRWMYWVQLVPSVVYLTASLILPESPRYLVIKGREREARAMMQRLWGASVDPERMIAEIRASVGETTGGETTGGEKRNANGLLAFPIVWVGIGLAFFQQASGINAVMYFGEYLWAAAGFTEQSGLLINVTLGAILVVSTVASMALVDRIGRRPLLLGGSAVMSSTLVILAALFMFSARGPQGTLQLTSVQAQITLVAEHLFIFAFGISWGPVVWVLLGEMFPNRIRARALALSAGAQWVTAFLVTTSFPPLLSGIGLGGVFCVYAAASIAAYLMVSARVRETKGMVLEDMPGI
ncbi:MAG TPA: sugar porter family MFS transporter [Steroidobacteraceae bacterium]|nr:sugar porter family MFS transporter [Steroidobacteraceae bacterium]